MHFYLCDWIDEWKTDIAHFKIEQCSNLKAIVCFFLFCSILQIISGTDDMISYTINLTVCTGLKKISYVINPFMTYI